MWQSLVSPIASIIDKLIPDKEAAAKAKFDLMSLGQAGELKELDAAMTVITAEATSEHWIVASWRPITMLVFVAIIANNYLLYPYLSLFWDATPILELPEKLYTLLEIGLGGYIAGRSIEKSVEAYSKHKQ